MSPSRRLRSIAAYSAAAIATAGLAGSSLAADECTDAECLSERGMSLLAPDGLMAGGMNLEFMRQMLEAQGMPQESVDQMMAFYELALTPGGGGGGGGKANSLQEMIQLFGGDEIPDEAMIKITDAYAQLGIDPDDLFAKLEVDAQAFPKVEDPGVAAFPKVEDVLGAPLDEAFIKYGLDGDTIDDLGGALGVVEAALAQAAAEGDIDQATLEAVLEMLSRD